MSVDLDTLVEIRADVPDEPLIEEGVQVERQEEAVVNVEAFSVGGAVGPGVDVARAEKQFGMARPVMAQRPSQ